MKKSLLSIIAAVALCLFAAAPATGAVESYEADSVSVVYYIKDISPESIAKIYKAVERDARGHNAGVLLSAPEEFYPTALEPQLVDALCEAAGAQVADLGKSDGYISLPVDGGYHLTRYDMSKDAADYGFMIVLTHLKGMYQSGFDGTIRNMALGFASEGTKNKILKPASAEADAVAESMADACSALVNYLGDTVIYITVAGKMTVDADGSRYTEEPQMADLGILASVDPVALDRACTDMIYNSSDPAAEHFYKHIDARGANHIVDATELLGAGTQQYFLITIE